MLNIYTDTIDIARDAGAAAKVIARQDGDLARQLRRAASSIALNVAEGSGVHGGNRRQRYATALGSARETLACFDVSRSRWTTSGRSTSGRGTGSTRSSRRW